MGALTLPQRTFVLQPYFLAVWPYLLMNSFKFQLVNFEFVSCNHSRSCSCTSHSRGSSHGCIHSRSSGLVIIIITVVVIVVAKVKS